MDDAPVLIDNNGLSLYEGDTPVLTTSELNVTDVDTAPSAINYTASGHPTGGKLLVNSVEQLTFTQEDLNNGDVAYRDDGSHAGFETSWTDSFDFSVTDGFTYTITDEGGNTSDPAVVTIDISGNTTPMAIGSIGPQSATELQVFTLTLDSNLFSDTADDSLAWEDY